MAWYEIRAAGDETTEVFIYDQIGEDWFGEGVTAKNFLEELADITTPTIHLRINSPGGSVWDAVAIYNSLERHPATVHAFNDGLAASAASLILTAGDTVTMAKNALLMIHEPYGMAIGDSGEMRKLADILDKTAETIANTYADKSGKTLDEVRAAMRAETWFTADEAVAFGLVDQVGTEMRMAANFDLSRFRNTPTTLISAMSASGPPSDGGADDPVPGTGPGPYIPPILT